MPRLPALTLTVLAATLLISQAAAETTRPLESAGRDASLVYQPPAWPEPPNLGAMVARLAIGTVLVLLLCAGTLWAGKRWLGGPVAPRSGTHQLHIVKALPLGGRCSLSLLNVGNCQVLVAVDSTGLKEMTLLSESFENTLGQLEHGANLANRNTARLPGSC